MEAKFEKGSPEFNFFADLYRFAAENYNPASKDDWQRMFDTAEKIKDKYINTTANEMCCEMIVAFMRVKSNENARKAKKE